jgi:hypothetical protein
MIPEGTKVTIKPEAWEREFQNRSYSYYPVQAVYEIGTTPPHEGMYMLTYPYYWWYEDDLELASSNSLANVDFVDGDEDVLDDKNEMLKIIELVKKWSHTCGCGESHNQAVIDLYDAISIYENSEYKKENLEK